jgi:hypothetical protein
VNAPYRITSQAVGAYGEKVVEAELLRRGWIPSNVNASIKNSVDFDIFAHKTGRTVHIRVKTCGPGMDAFQFSALSGRRAVRRFQRNDFTILVRMGASRSEDSFYVMPTADLRSTIRRYSKEYLAQTRRDGRPRKDTGHWTLFLFPLRSGERRQNRNLQTKWLPFLTNWKLLERRS